MEQSEAASESRCMIHLPSPAKTHS